MEQQQRLLARCAEILGVDRLSPHDDFFGAGGDSLDAVEVSEMLTDELGRDVSMADVLGSASFAQMFRSLTDE